MSAFRVRALTEPLGHRALLARSSCVCPGHPVCLVKQPQLANAMLTTSHINHHDNHPANQQARTSGPLGACRHLPLPRGRHALPRRGT